MRYTIKQPVILAIGSTRWSSMLLSMILLPGILLLAPGKAAAADRGLFDRYFKLIPAPQTIEVSDGKGILFTDIRNVFLKNIDQPPVLTGILESLPFTGVETSGSLVLMIDKNLALPSDGGSSERSGGSSGEGYILEVRNNRVIIRAKERAGLFYGVQTLNQLLEDAHDQSVEIPPCRITDYPKIACRAVHLDLKSHLDAGYYYYNIIDRLAKIKVNTIIVEFEDKLRYRKAKDVGAPNAISVEEFIEISKYAKDRNIEISPLVQGLGHASFILKHEAYKELRDDPASDYVFDPLNPKTYELQFSLYEDAMAATPFGKYLHVGGDEVDGLGKSALSKKSGMKPLELQMYWLKKVTDFAVAHHRIPIFWDDMVFKLAGLYETTYDAGLDEKTVIERWNKNKAILDDNISLFPKNCVYNRWNYESPLIKGNRLAIDWYKEHGLDVMPATAAQQSYLMVQRNNSNFRAIKDFCRLTAEKKLDKILCTLWDDSSPHFETVWRGLYDFAWFSWNDADCTEEFAHAAFRHRFFAPALEASAYEFQNGLERSIVFWETALLQEGGDRENYHPVFKLLELPDTLKSGEWSLKNKDRLKNAADAMNLYRQTKTRIDQSMLLARRNRYALDVMNQINEVQSYSARLLLGLQEFDQSKTSRERQQARLLLKQCVEGFPVLRSHLEKVFSVTKMLTNPEGYQYDMNPRAHWADIANNTDWMYFYELAMNKKLVPWLVGQGIHVD